MASMASIDNEDNSLVTSAEISCLTCDMKTSKVYEPRIVYSEFIDDKAKLLCSKCNSVCISIPHFDNELSAEEWRSLVKSKYDVLKQTIESNLPQLWLAIEFILAIKSIMNIQGVTLPWFGILLGRPSSLKTAGIEALRDTPGTFYTDIFTPKAFVSNSTAVSKEKLKDIDMLPKIKNQLFLVSELSAIFTKKDDELVEILGIFTRLADGHGLKTNTGAHGERGYRDTYFNMIGAAVDIPYKVYKYLGYLGPKLYFLRMPKGNKTENDYLQEMYQDEYPIKFRKIREALNDYLNVFAKCPDMDIEDESKLARIPWSGKDDDKQSYRLIVRLAMLLSHLRAVVVTYDTGGHSGTDYAYATAIREERDRAITQLRNLARGHALSQGRNHITLDDIPLLIKVVLSTASIDRVNVFDLLIAHKGTLKTSIIEASLNMSDTTARKTMTELKAIELVDMPKPKASNEELTIELKDGFNWFLKREFSKLRDGFIPTNNVKFLKKKDDRESLLKQKCPPSSPSAIEPEAELKPPIMEQCPKCGEEVEAYYLKYTHRCHGTD